MTRMLVLQPPINLTQAVIMFARLCAAAGSPQTQALRHTTGDIPREWTPDVLRRIVGLARDEFERDRTEGTPDGGAYIRFWEDGRDFGLAYTTLCLTCGGGFDRIVVDSDAAADLIEQAGLAGEEWQNG